MAEMQKWKAGEAFDPDRLWSEMDDDFADRMARVKVVAAKRGPDGLLQPTDSEAGLTVTKWMNEGVPALRGAKEGDSFVEKWETVAPDDPLFDLALRDAIEDQGWSIE